MNKKVRTIAAGLIAGLVTTFSAHANSVIIEKDGMLIIEAESMTLKGGWKQITDASAAGGKYIDFTGANSYNTVNSAQTAEATFRISNPGKYTLRWLMRQPDECEGDKCNDAWINLPDATQYAKGQVITGFHKFVGRSKGEFGWNGSLSDVHDIGSSWLTLNFPTAGDYTLQISGRSNGFQLDRIVMFKGISDADAQVLAATKSELRETLTIAPVGETVAFKAMSNGKYVCSDKMLDSQNWILSANRAAVGGWEKFTVVDMGDNTVALKAMGNGKFVTASATLDPLTNPLAASVSAADESQISAAETFLWVVNEDGTVSLKAQSNGQYVSADKFKDPTNPPVIANRATIGGWEKFTVEIK